jgi:hypothetical protein
MPKPSTPWEKMQKTHIQSQRADQVHVRQGFKTALKVTAGGAAAGAGAGLTQRFVQRQKKRQDEERRMGRRLGTIRDIRAQYHNRATFEKALESGDYEKLLSIHQKERLRAARKKTFRK